MDIPKSVKQMSIEEKKQKIAANRETIRVLQDRLDETPEEKKFGFRRTQYINIIFKMTRVIDLQNEKLVKSTSDIRLLQREISSLSGRLERSFKLAETTIFRDTKGDDWGRECYRLLSTMHEKCDQLVEAVQETGDLTREIRQLEHQIGQIKANQAFLN